MSAIPQSRGSTIHEPPTLKPLAFAGSLACFGIPTVLLFIGIHALIPALKTMGLTEFQAFATVMITMTALLLVASIVRLTMDGYPLTRQTFAQRFRYGKFTWRDAALGVGLFVAAFVGYGLFSGIGTALIQNGAMPLPATLPALIDPRNQLSMHSLTAMIGGSIVGNWGVLLLYFVMLFFNIVGEEFWWRGYILPRQELRFGHWTWLIHGVMWTLFHAFKWWDLIGLLPVCLIFSYAAQRTKRNWPVFVAHYIFNGLGFIIFALAVAGRL